MSADLLPAMLDGSRAALSRVLSLVENRRAAFDEVLRAVAPRLGAAVRVGFTGPPGAGKSSLVTAYTKLLRTRGQRVGILAVDPTSPFSGGALLGDRVRMNAVALDAGVFVRSVATRGDLGGLAEAVGDMADVMDAAGFDVILIETVGVGQSELEIVQYADCTVVVLVPESGDAIQGMKAGLMEIADVFAINKSDRDGADRFVSELRGAMQLKEWQGWIPPLVKTVAVRDGGMSEFHAAVERYVAALKSSGEFESRRAARTRRRIRRILEHRVMSQFWTTARVAELEAAIEANRSPHEIVHSLLHNR